MVLCNFCIQLRPLDGSPAIIRIDPVPSFKALVDNKLLQQYKISLELLVVPKILTKTQSLRKLSKSWRTNYFVKNLSVQKQLI